MKSLVAVLFVCGIFWGTITGTDVSVRRHKREAALLRSIKALTFRVTNLETALLAEQDITQELKIQLTQLKTEKAETDKKEQGRSMIPSEEMVRQVANLVREEMKKDLEVLSSGMVLEKQNFVGVSNVVENFKTDLNRLTGQMGDVGDKIKHVGARLDAVDDMVTDLGDHRDGTDEVFADFGHQMDAVEENIKQLTKQINSINGTLNCLNSSLTDVNATVTEVKTKINTHSLVPGSGISSGKCPSYGKAQSPFRISSGNMFGPEVCLRRSKYVYLMTMKKPVVALPNESRLAVIATGIHIGDRQIYRSAHALLQLPRDCEWPKMETGKFFWIFSDKKPGEGSRRNQLGLENSIILEIPTGENLRMKRFLDAILYKLRRGDWNSLCRQK